MSDSEEEEMLVGKISRKDSSDDEENDKPDWGTTYMKSEHLLSMNDGEVLKSINNNMLSRETGNKVPNKTNTETRKKKDYTMRQSVKKYTDYNEKREKGCMPFCCFKPPKPTFAHLEEERKANGGDMY